MFIVNVLDYHEENNIWYVQYCYGPFDKYEHAIAWTRNFPDKAQVSKLIRPTYNAD